MVGLDCATLSPARPGRTKTRPCPCVHRLNGARSPSKEAATASLPNSPLHQRIWGNLRWGWWGCPQLRASNEGLPRPRVARAKRTAPPSLFLPYSLKIGELFVRVPWMASTARIERAQLYRARSASKEAARAPLLSYPHTLFNTSRYASSIFPKSFRNRSLSIDSFVV